MRALFGDRNTSIQARRQSLTVDCFDTAEQFRDFFTAGYGPTIAVYRSLAEAPERAVALDRKLLELAERHELGSGTMEWEYLLFTATVA